MWVNALAKCMDKGGKVTGVDDWNSKVTLNLTLSLTLNLSLTLTLILVNIVS